MNRKGNSTFWLTTRRMRTHALLLALALWSIYAVDMSTPGMLDRNGLIKGTDFLHFYTLGTLALRGRGDLLYDIQRQAEIAQQSVPAAKGHTYAALYGPQVSLLFAPLARMSYGWALVVWLLLNLFIYVTCCYAVWRTCPHLQNAGLTVALAALAFPGFFHLLAWGQTSGLALLCFTLAYLVLRKRWQFAAGLAIGTLIFKPQLGLAAAVVFLFAREWKIISGAALAAATQLAVGWLHYGTAVVSAYWRTMAEVQRIMPILEPRPYQMHSVRAFWSLLIPWPRISFGLYLLSAIAVLALATVCWKRSSSLSIRYSALLLATVIVSPHLTVYDLVILAPAFLFLGDWLASDESHPLKQSAAWLLYACYPLFLLGPLAQITHLQLSVLAMIWLLWICCRVADCRFPLHATPATLVTP